METSLWVNDAQHRYFLIPVDQNLPVGPWVLRSLNGQEQYVDSQAVAQYEISETKAASLLEDQIDQAMAQTRVALSQALVIDPNSGLFKTTPEAQAAALTLLSSMIGVSPEELKQDPQHLRSYLESFLTEIRSGLAAGIEDPNALVPIQNQLNAIQDQFQAQGISVDLDLEPLLQQAQAQGGSHTEMEQTLEQLQPLILLLKRAVMESPELQSALIDLVPTSTLPAADPRVQEDYRQTAKRAVSEAMANVSIPKFDFNDLSQPAS